MLLEIDFTQLTPVPIYQAFWGSLLFGLASLAGAAINYFSAKDTNNQQRDMMREQNAFNEKMQDKQNEYNSPGNQKRLYEQAGINPAFLFGGQSGLDSTSGLASGASVPGLTPPQFDSQSIIQSMFDAKKLQNETISMDVDNEKKLQETEQYKIQNANLQKEYDAKISEIQSNKELNDAEKDKAIEEAKSEKLRQQEILMHTLELAHSANLFYQRAQTEGWTQKEIEQRIERSKILTPLEAKDLIASANLKANEAEVAANTINKVQREIKFLIQQGRNIDASTINQLIKNQVDDMKAYNEISAELLKSDSPVLNLIYQNCNGILGDVAKFCASYAVGFTDSQDSSGHKREVNYYRHQNQFLFPD